MVKQSFTVRDLPVSERPRERLVKFGAEALSAQELLALLLGRGVPGESVMMTAQRLLSTFGSLQGVLDASLEDLQNMNGIGKAKASQVKASLEIARRVKVSQDTMRDASSIQVPLTSPWTVFELVRATLGNYAKEHFLVLSFDARNKLLGMDTVSIGTLTASLVHPRETFECAIRRHADHVILAHNHPSGDPDASEEDKQTTKRLREAGRILGIEVVDHLIVSSAGYMSFKEQRLL
jgi:DNA repair protein RadC